MQPNNQDMLEALASFYQASGRPAEAKKIADRLGAGSRLYER